LSTCHLTRRSISEIILSTQSGAFRSSYQNSLPILTQINNATLLVNAQNLQTGTVHEPNYSMVIYRLQRTQTLWC